MSMRTSKKESDLFIFVDLSLVIAIDCTNLHNRFKFQNHLLNSPEQDEIHALQFLFSVEFILKKRKVGKTVIRCLVLVSDYNYNCSIKIKTEMIKTNKHYGHHHGNLSSR